MHSLTATLLVTTFAVSAHATPVKDENLIADNAVRTIPLIGSYFKDHNQYIDIGPGFEVSFGTPPQTFRMSADLGSPDIWIPGKQFVTSMPKFDPTKSSTFVNETTPWLFEYGGPDADLLTFVKGYVAEDTISLGSLSIKNKTFAVATNGSAGQADGQFDGIFGLSHDHTVSAYHKPTFIQAAVAEGLLPSPEFGIHLRRAQDTPGVPPPDPTSGIGYNSQGGELTLGGIDTTKINGSITYTPLTIPGFWQFNIDGFWVNGKFMPGTNHTAVSDTGASIIVLPPKIAATFYSLTGGTAVPGTPEYTWPCNKTLDVQVQVGGKKFQIKAQDLNGGFVDSSMVNCYSNILGANATNANTNGTYPSNNTDVIILGVPFLLNVYGVFDYSNGGRVGFANLIDNGKTPAIAPLDVVDRNSSLTGY